jgi:pimeloyl-ACP methyl ester carboxylesterase
LSNSLNIQRYGSGNLKLVAIHGLGSGSSAWNLVKPEFSKHLEFITIDLPGHGAAFMKANTDMSPARLAEIIKDELLANRIDKFHLMGNSLGGWICLEMAARYPRNVLTVTGVAPAGLWLKAKTHRNGELAISRYMARATYKFAHQIAHFKFMRAIGFKLVSPQWEKFAPDTCAEAAIAMGSATGYYTLWDAFLGKRFEQQISEKIPVTILFGDTDNTLPEDSCQERSLTPQHSHWKILPKSGHAPMWDSVIEVVQETLKTIKKAN